VVKKAFFGGALILTKMDGDDLSKLVNSDIVKKYYIMYCADEPINIKV
jgi:hypothetical protein